MIEFELQIRGQNVGKVIISDEAHEKICELRGGYLQEEGAASSVLFKSAVNVGGAISTVITLKGENAVHFAAVDVSKDNVDFLLELNGLKTKFNITNMFT